MKLALSLVKSPDTFGPEGVHCASVRPVRACCVQESGALAANLNKLWERDPYRRT